MRRVRSLCTFVLVLLPGAAAAQLHDVLVRESVALERAGDLAAAGRLPHGRAAEALSRHATLQGGLETATGAIEPRLADKARALLGLRQRLEALDRLGRPATPHPTPAHVAMQLAGGAGEHCATAIPLRPGQGFRVPLAANAARWFRVEGEPDVPLSVTTRGSTLDPQLSAFADCRVADRAPLARVDDSFGLQADLPLLPDRQTFWYVRVDNLGATGELAISSMRAAVLRGGVAAAADGAGVPGVHVAYFRIDGDQPVFDGLARTDSQGRYALAAVAGAAVLRTGSSTVVSGHVHQANGLRACDGPAYHVLAGCGADVTDPTRLVVAEGSRTEVDFTLRGGASVAGTLQSGTGGPVVGGTVRLFNAAGLDAGQATTDAQGRWRIDGVAPAGVYVVGSAIDHAVTLHAGIECSSTTTCPLGQGTLVATTPGEVVRVDLTLRRQPFLEVAFTIDGVPVLDNFITGITVSLLNDGGVPVAETSAVENGRFRLGPLAPGTYRMRAQSRTAYPRLYPDVDCASDCLAELPSGGTVVIGSGGGGASLSMALRGYPSLSGRITDRVSGEPIDDAAVYLVDPAGPRYWASTGPGGAYYLPDVVPGTYALRFIAPRHADELYDDIPCDALQPVANCPGATPLTFGPGSTDRVVDAQLERSAAISGRVRSPDGEATPGVAQLAIIRADGTTASVFSIAPDLDGSYVAPDVPPGTWRVGAARGFAYVPQLFSDLDCPQALLTNNYVDCGVGMATPVVVVAGGSAGGVDFTLRRSGSQRVRVLDALDDSPIPGVAVDAWNAQGLRVDTRPTDVDGRTFVFAPAGGNATPHALSTDNLAGYINEVFEDIECAGGSVFFGSCGLAGHTPVMLPALNNAPEVVIRIAKPIPVFTDGFEP